MSMRATVEGVTIALDSLRSNKVRAFLTILGVAIGVATVTLITSIMAGVEKGISDDVASIGAANFVVSRFDQTQVQFSNTPPWEGKPKLTMDEAAVMEELPSVQSVTPVVSTGGSVRYGNKNYSSISLVGLGPEWTTYVRGEFLQGRPFLQNEYDRSATVAVISADVAEEVFGGGNAIGATLRLQGVPHRVVGVFKPKPNLFEGGQQLWAYVPATTAFKSWQVEDDFLEFWVVPAPAVSQERAMDDVTVTLRSLRKLKPGEENDFALVRQEAFAELMGRITGAITLVMTLLASIGLMVGGVGVVGIMLISVTERTREIGVRKALGARRGEILWQFLVEASTVTVIGALVGLAFGGGGALLLAAFTPIPAQVPLWAVAMALVAAAATGILFGLYPAWRAARLDPVDALRYE
ncbi:MAG TPA: ABC transporter permease [Longimicrobium sp.]|nr:ABC transporter permease [Longimicrobium sp.]